VPTSTGFPADPSIAAGLTLSRRPGAGARVIQIGEELAEIAERAEAAAKRA